MNTNSRAILVCAAALTVEACSGETMTGVPQSSFSAQARRPDVASDDPSLQAWAENGCRGGDPLTPVAPGHPDDRNADLAVCQSSDGSTYDNKLPGGGGNGGGGWVGGCHAGDQLLLVGPGHPDDRNGDLAVCQGSNHTYDNKLASDHGGGGGGGGWVNGCHAGDELRLVAPGDPNDKNGDLAICLGNNGPYDNKLEGGNGGGGSGGGGWVNGCRAGDELRLVAPGNPDDANGDLAICIGSKGPYDNRLGH